MESKVVPLEALDELIGDGDSVALGGGAVAVALYWLFKRAKWL